MYQAILFDLEGVIIDKDSKIIPGFLDALTICKSLGKSYCVTTGASSMTESKKIDIARSYIGDAVYSSVDLGYGAKSNPDFFAYVLSDLGYAPAQSILIDDGNNGIMGALGAGIATFYLSRKNNIGAKYYGDYDAFLDLILCPGCR